MLFLLLTFFEPANINGNKFKFILKQSDLIIDFYLYVELVILIMYSLDLVLEIRHKFFESTNLTLDNIIK